MLSISVKCCIQSRAFFCLLAVLRPYVVSDWLTARRTGARLSDACVWREVGGI